MRSQRSGGAHDKFGSDADRRGRQVPSKARNSGQETYESDHAGRHRHHHHWKLLSPERRRAAVHHLMKVMGVSERFACRVTGQNRTTQRGDPAGTTVSDPDAELRRWLRQYAKEHPRRGFRPAYHDARGEGWNVNHKKIQRLWREEGPRVPQRRRRKRLGTSTTPNPPMADAPNKVWAVDFQCSAHACISGTDDNYVVISGRSPVYTGTRRCMFPRRGLG